MQVKEFLYFFHFWALQSSWYWRHWKEGNKRFLPLAWASVSPEGRWLPAELLLELASQAPLYYYSAPCFLFKLQTNASLSSDTEGSWEFWDLFQRELQFRFHRLNNFNREDITSIMYTVAVIVPFSYSGPRTCRN